MHFIWESHKVRLSPPLSEPASTQLAVPVDSLSRIQSLIIRQGHREERGKGRRKRNGIFLLLSGAPSGTHMYAHKTQPGFIMDSSLHECVVFNPDHSLVRNKDY